MGCSVVPGIFPGLLPSEFDNLFHMKLGGKSWEITAGRSRCKLGSSWPCVNTQLQEDVLKGSGAFCSGGWLIAPSPCSVQQRALQPLCLPLCTSSGVCFPCAVPISRSLLWVLH